MMVLHKKLFYILSILLTYQNISAGIKTIWSLNEAKSIFDSLDKNALVIFDIDDTLIVAQDKIRRKNPKHLIAEFTKKHFDDLHLPAKRKEHLASIRKKMTIRTLMETSSPAIIQDLQSRGIKVIALTHLYAGSYGIIDRLEEWRFNQLYDMGIDFSINNPIDIVFQNLPTTRNQHPNIYKGIFVTAESCLKGEALAALIEKLEYKPSLIVFIDDCEIQIQSVSQALAKLEIPSICYHYRAAEACDNNIDIEVAKFQYQYLITNEKWLSDAEAKAIMAGLMISL